MPSSSFYAYFVHVLRSSKQVIQTKIYPNKVLKLSYFCKFLFAISFLRPLSKVTNFNTSPMPPHFENFSLDTLKSEQKPSVKKPVDRPVNRRWFWNLPVGSRKSWPVPSLHQYCDVLLYTWWDSLNWERWLVEHKCRLQKPISSADTQWKNFWIRLWLDNLCFNAMGGTRTQVYVCCRKFKNIYVGSRAISTICPNSSMSFRPLYRSM